MTRPTLELAGIFRRHGPGYRETHSLPVHHHKLMREALQKAYRSQQLQFFSELEPLREPAVFAAYLKRPRSSQWVVYAKAPFGGPEQAIAYLGRYTHRVAISNHRLRSLANGQVSFEWKDYRDHNQSKTMTLEAGEFIRRFLLHSLPPGFQRIRHYGFLANVHRRENLALCRELLTHDPAALLPAIAPAGPDEAFLDQLPRCPVCGIGVMIRIERLLPLPAPGVDSS